jgi:4'-phosphopantetheinyl transferase
MQSSPLHSPAITELHQADDPALRLWLIDLDRHATHAPMLGLTAHELQRAERLHSLLQGQRQRAARHALRLILAEALGCAPGDVKLAAGSFGKPALQGGEGPHFNLSHREHLALVGLHEHQPIGVDVEVSRPLSDLDGLLASALSADERAAAARLAPAERLAHFYGCWTRKEAVLKALGVGVAAPLPSIDVGPGPGLRHLRLDLPAGRCGAAVGSIALPEGAWGAWASSDPASVAHAHTAWG